MAKVAIADLLTGDEFITPDGEPARVYSPLGAGEDELARLAIVTESKAFVEHVDWPKSTRVEVRTRAEQPTPPDIENWG